MRRSTVPIFILFFLPLTCLIAQNKIREFEQDLIRIVNKVRPSVVSIFLIRENGAVKSASGVILDTQGHLATVAEVEGVQSIVVRLANGRKYSGQLMGTDDLTHLVVIKIKASDLQPAPCGDSAQLQVGAFLVIIGNPFGLPHSVSTGIVSGLQRTVQKENAPPLTGLIQTTAPINPGDAGGLVSDSQGQFVGMVNCTLGRAPSFLRMDLSMESQGIHFILPSTTIYWVTQQLIAHGKIDRGWIGIQVEDVLDGQGVKIERVVPGSPAEQARLIPEDIVISCNGHAIIEKQDLQFLLSHTVEGERITFELLRQQKKVSAEVVLGKSPREK